MLSGVLGFLVGLAAGCGGGEGLTRQQYVSQLNSMCEDFSEREKEIGEPQTLADLVKTGPQILEAFEQAIVDKVGNLEAPDEIADQADRFVELADEQRAVIAGLIDAAKENDRAKARELAARNQALNTEANSIAGELGAQSCAEGVDR